MCMCVLCFWLPYKEKPNGLITECKFLDFMDLILFLYIYLSNVYFLHETWFLLWAIPA